MRQKFNYKLIARIVGVMLLLLGVQMLVPATVSFSYKEHAVGVAFLISSGIICSFGVFLRFIVSRNAKFDLRRKEGFLIVGFVWILASLGGSIPYMLSGALPRFVDAFFEAMSGFTSTGATVITNLSSTPKGIIFWRSFSQWLGGGGIILLTIIILRKLKESSQYMYIAEVPGPIKAKIHPKTKETARRFWYVYLGLTVLLFAFLFFGDMSVFDAVCHTLSTVSTGGFSTHVDGIASFSRYTQYVIVAFMFLSAVNFGLVYFLLRRQPRKVWNNEEFRWYFIAILFFSLLVFLGLKFYSNYPLEAAFRHAVFSVVSTISTTGYVIHNNMTWVIFIPVGLFAMMIIGGCSGSTAGGLKIDRVILLAKFLYAQLKKQLHPNAIFPVKNNGTIVSQEVVHTIFAFFFLYIMFFVSGAFILTLTGESIRDAMSMSVSAIGNIGPIAADLCPNCSFANLHGVSKWTLTFLMMAGRLELFAVVALFSPSFWKS